MLFGPTAFPIANARITNRSQPQNAFFRCLLLQRAMRAARLCADGCESMRFPFGLCADGWATGSDIAPAGAAPTVLHLLGPGSRDWDSGRGREVASPTKSVIKMPAPLAPRSGDTVRILDEDLELAAAVDQVRFNEARLAAVAPLITVPKGHWRPPSVPRAQG